jgi:RNA polymerase sigma-70 factor (ECF subfamily)
MIDRAELERLYDTHASAIFAFLLNFTRSEADTRDLMQDLFLKVVRHPESFTQARDERAYLLRLAHNAAIDLIRRRGAREKYHTQLGGEIAHDFVVASDPDQELFRQAVARGLADLPADQRAVVHLKLWEGMTFAEIAAALDLSPNTAASRYRYGVDKMRDLLRPLYDEIQ